MVRSRSIVGGVVALAVLCARAVEAEVLIGLAAPLTGHMAWAGASNQVAPSAVDDLNAKGGVLGEQINVVAVDDACDPDPSRRSRAEARQPITARTHRFRPRPYMPPLAC